MAGIPVGGVAAKSSSAATRGDEIPEEERVAEAGRVPFLEGGVAGIPVGDFAVIRGGEIPEGGRVAEGGRVPLLEGGVAGIPRGGLETASAGLTTRGGEVPEGGRESEGGRVPLLEGGATGIPVGAMAAASAAETPAKAEGTPAKPGPENATRPSRLARAIESMKTQLKRQGHARLVVNYKKNNVGFVI